MAEKSIPRRRQEGEAPPAKMGLLARFFRLCRESQIKIYGYGGDEPRAAPRRGWPKKVPRDQRPRGRPRKRTVKLAPELVEALQKLSNDQRSQAWAALTEYIRAKGQNLVEIGLEDVAAWWEVLPDRPDFRPWEWGLLPVAWQMMKCEEWKRRAAKDKRLSWAPEPILEAIRRASAGGYNVEEITVALAEWEEYPAFVGARVEAVRREVCGKFEKPEANSFAALWKAEKAKYPRGRSVEEWVDGLAGWLALRRANWPADRLAADARSYRGVWRLVQRTLRGS